MCVSATTKIFYLPELGKSITLHIITQAANQYFLVWQYFFLFSRNQAYGCFSLLVGIYIYVNLKSFDQQM